MEIFVFISFCFCMPTSMLKFNSLVEQSLYSGYLFFFFACCVCFSIHPCCMQQFFAYTVFFFVLEPHVATCFMQFKRFKISVELGNSFLLCAQLLAYFHIWKCVWYIFLFLLFVFLCKKSILYTDTGTFTDGGLLGYLLCDCWLVCNILWRFLLIFAFI